jgi:hypothetical protein
MLFGGRGSLTILTGNGMGWGGSGSAMVDRMVTKPDFMAGDVWCVATGGFFTSRAYTMCEKVDQKVK